jgi:hypothetical protein
LSLPSFAFWMDLLAQAPESMCAILLCRASMPRHIFRTAIRSCVVPSGAVRRFAPKVLSFTNLPTVYSASSLKEIWANSDYTHEYEFVARARIIGYTLSFWADNMARPGHQPIRSCNIRAGSTQFERSLAFNAKVCNQRIIEKSDIIKPKYTNNKYKERQVSWRSRLIALKEKNLTGAVRLPWSGEW